MTTTMISRRVNPPERVCCERLFILTKTDPRDATT
jgi:hypothetical protein